MHYKIKKAGPQVVVAERNRCVESYEEDVEFPSFDLNTIVDATNQFSFSNKIGEGGFGPVYKVVYVIITIFNLC